MPLWSITVLTRCGRGHSSSEDALSVNGQVFAGDMSDPETIVVENANCLVMVADGIGGQVHGALASDLALRKLNANPSSTFVYLADCTTAVREANTQLYQTMRERPETRGMGTTVVGAAMSSDNITVFNVGDSPCFIHQPGQLLELTERDVPKRDIRASKPHSSHAITQSLGGTTSTKLLTPHHTSVRPDWSRDALLLCSDGLTDTVDEAFITDVLDNRSSGVSAIIKLHAEAVRSGGRDDVSIILAESR